MSDNTLMWVAILGLVLAFASIWVMLFLICARLNKIDAGVMRAVKAGSLTLDKLYPSTDPAEVKKPKRKSNKTANMGEYRKSYMSEYSKTHKLVKDPDTGKRHWVPREG